MLRSATILNILGKELLHSQTWEQEVFRKGRQCLTPGSLSVSLRVDIHLSAVHSSLCVCCQQTNNAWWPTQSLSLGWINFCYVGSFLFCSFSLKRFKKGDCADFFIFRCDFPTCMISTEKKLKCVSLFCFFSLFICHICSIWSPTQEHMQTIICSAQTQTLHVHEFYICDGILFSFLLLACPTDDPLFCLKVDKPQHFPWSTLSTTEFPKQGELSPQSCTCFLSVFFAPILPSLPDPLYFTFFFHCPNFLNIFIFILL